MPGFLLRQLWHRAYMFRLFAALPVSADTSNQLAALQTGLIGAAWRPIENFHITLRYFGDLSAELAEELDRELAQIEAGAFNVRLQGVGWFGRRKPRAVWAGVEESAPLRDLSSKCERAARRLGLPPDKHPFTPHITLAYLHHTSPEDLHIWADARKYFTAEPLRFEGFHLYSSQLGNGPGRYRVEADYPLA